MPNKCQLVFVTKVEIEFKRLTGHSHMVNQQQSQNTGSGSFCEKVRGYCQLDSWLRLETWKIEAEEEGMTEDEMIGWPHRLNGHEFE